MTAGHHERRLRVWARQVVRSGRGREAANQARSDPRLAELIALEYQQLLDAQRASLRATQGSRTPSP